MIDRAVSGTRIRCEEQEKIRPRLLRLPLVTRGAIQRPRVKCRGQPGWAGGRFGSHVDTPERSGSWPKTIAVGDAASAPGVTSIRWIAGGCCPSSPLRPPYSAYFLTKLNISLAHNAQVVNEWYHTTGRRAVRWSDAAHRRRAASPRPDRTQGFVIHSMRCGSSVLRLDGETPGR